MAIDKPMTYQLLTNNLIVVNWIENNKHSKQLLNNKITLSSNGERNNERYPIEPTNQQR
ncbi:hypothetical protein TUM4630_18100 [Shewanella algidipiscicola]|uniref:Uncharacterized protein n=1 Tax=Shewanella algidipiscicola TaxID=614070 RepID=A0ABQ4PGT7_9GAMM|nr:hypothetical protein TUM4630_18100 [Shewanella algidipiscicola]